MRTIRIVAVGKIKQSAKYLQAGIDLYQKRLARDVRLEWIELPEEAPSPTRPVEQIMEREAEAILKQCQWADVTVLLNERGRMLSSEDFASWLSGGNPLNGGPGSTGSDRIIFIIGGAHGTAPGLEKQVSTVLSLSPMTFPHQMVRLLLVEQIYRAYTIIHHEPYHK